MPLDVAGEVQDEAVVLPRRQAAAAPGDLNVEAWRLRRPSQRDQVDRRHVEAGRQHAHAGQRSDPARLEVSHDPVALGLGRVPEDVLAGVAPRPHKIPDVLRVAHASAEEQPRPAVLAERDRLIDDGPVDGVDVHRALEVAGDEVSAPRADACHVQLRLGRLAHQRREVALLDRAAHAVLVGDAVEDRALALVEPAAVHAVRRGGQADDLQVGVDDLQLPQELSIHRVRRARDQVRLVDQDDVDLAELGRAVVDRLDPGEGDLSSPVTLPQAGGVDADRGLGPEAQQLLGVLSDQLADMRQHQDARALPLQASAAGLGQDEALAGAGRQHDQCIAGAALPPAEDRLDGFLLIGAQLDHGFGSGFASRPSVQVVPSCIA